MDNQTFLQSPERGPVSSQVARHLLEMVERERLLPGDGMHLRPIAEPRAQSQDIRIGPGVGSVR